MLAIDAEALGERPLSEVQRTSLEVDPQRRRQLAEHRRRQEAFLSRFPTFESLSAAAGENQRRSANPRSRLRLAIVPLTAAAVLALIALLPRHEPHERQGDERIKGASLVPLEMAVVREGVALPFAGQAVREGDKLIFRARVAVDYLSIFSLEASGRVQAILIDRAQNETVHSLAVHLPPNAQLAQGIEVDSYTGRERIVAVASAAPLPAERIADWLRTSYAAMSTEGRAALPLASPPFAAQVTTWLLDKDTP
jgi:hypothetical protein